MAQCAVRVCEICERLPGKQYCINCEQYFCDNCKMSHLKAKVSKSHKFEEAEKVNPDVKIPKCEQHHEYFSFYCNTCICLICHFCLSETHKKHDFSHVTEAVSRKRTEVKSSIYSAEMSVNKLQTNVSMLETDLAQFQGHSKKVIEDIDSKRKEIIKMVNIVAEDYITKVKQNETKEIQRMKQEIGKRAQAVQEDRVIIKDAKQAVDDQDDVTFLNAVVNISNKLTSFKLLQSHVNKLLKAEFIKELAEIKDIENLVGTLRIQSMRSITSVKVGDHVKVKASVKNPTHGWGDVKKDSTGTVVKITKNLLYVSFPEQKRWEADISDLEFA